MDKNNNFSRYAEIHPAWRSFIALCERMRYGEIERLKIQNGIPVLAEEIRKKVKFPDKREKQ